MSTTDTVFRWIRIVRAIFVLLTGVGMIIFTSFLIAEKHEGPNGDLILVLCFGLFLTAMGAWVLKRSFTHRP